MTAQKKLSINMVSNLISFMVIFGISFFLTPYLVKSLGASAYGFFPLANNFILYLGLITIALNSMSSRFITIEIKKKNYDNVNMYVSSTYYSNLLLSFLMIVPLSLLVINLNEILNIPEEILVSVKFLFAFLFVDFLIKLCSNVYSIAPFAMNRLDLSALNSLINSLIRGSLTFFIFMSFKPSIAYIGLIAIISTLVSIGMNYFITKRLLPNLEINKKFFNYFAVKELLTSGIWNAISQLSTILLMGLSLLISNIFFGAVLFGQYSIAQTVPNFIMSLLSVLSSVFLPSLTYLFADGKTKEMVEQIKFSNKLIALLINIPITIFIVFGNEFYSLWTPNEDSDRLYIITLIIIAPIVISGSNSVLFGIFTITNKLKIPSLMFMFLGVLNVLITLLLVHTTDYGLFIIPVVTSLLSFLSNFLFLPLYSSKCLNVKWYTFYSEILKSVFVILILVGMLSVVKTHIEINSWLKLLSIIGISSIISFFINAIVIFEIKELKKYFIKLITIIFSKKKEDR